MAETKKKELSAAIGKRVGYFRRLAGLTQEQLAEKAGLSKDFISHVEAGTGTLSLTSLYVVAETLQVSCDALLGDPIDDPHIKNISKMLSKRTPEERENMERIVRDCLRLCDNINPL